MIEEFRASAICFDGEATQLVGLVRQGLDLVAPGNDPQILLQPTRPIPAGWCRFVLEIEGEIRNPRVYLDFGEGFRESSSVPLDSSAQQQSMRRGVTFLRAPVRHLRLDPSDGPDRFRLKAFLVDPLFPQPSALERIRWRWNRSSAQGMFAQQKERAQVVFSERTHLSGVSVLLDPGCGEEGAITVELHADDGDGVQALRSAVIDPAKVEPGEMEHLYWEPVEMSKDRFFFLHARLAKDDTRPHFATPRLFEAKLIYSPPQGYVALPQALLFSPVSQCNLNCTHCISRPTRSKLRIASEATWDAVQEITRGENFVHLATDYSGDILFDERRHPGTLARIIALDAKFRVDTNANCLDDDIVDMLFGSKMWEINFSLDSMDPDVYRSIRRGSIPLGEVLAKIARFMSRKRAAQKEIHTLISFALMRSNAATIKPALAFARENGIDHVNVVPLLAFTEDMLDEIFFWDEVAFAELHAELTTEAARLGVALAIPAPVQRWREDDIHAPCEVPWGTVAITANGDVMACCMPGTVIGNLNEQSLDDIWTGPSFAAFRRRINSPNPPASCRNCGMSRVRNNRRAYAPVHYALPTPSASPATLAPSSRC